ncbi:MAG: type ISP restriction/modification enzyme [Desulfobaccales bacterium]|nr:type ISP restriction/modification enzyme [Desulfobaccales bacterium]
MIEAFKVYFEQIKKLDVKDSTEHTLRPALDALLNALAGKKIKVIHEPKHDPTGKGAPDFKFKTDECILGYLENKKIGEKLDQFLKSDQIVKYNRLSGNLILTNYLEWIWLKDGAILKRETLGYLSDVGYPKARLDPDKAKWVAALIAAFLSTPPKGIGRAKDLALALAIRCHELREFLTEELIRQEREHQQGKLFGLFGIFKKDVFHELDIAGFADAFAQMLGYGLFLARLNNGNGAPISLNNAKQFIPTNFELIRELVDFLDEMDKEEYREIKGLIEEILSILNTLNLAALQEDLAFSKRQGRLFLQTEEERLLFAKDPYVYFYEGFLKAYDKDMRKSRGVYYTPRPVVNFIVRAVNDILKSTFGIPEGLADRKRVTVLDFATGTGTFLLEVLQQILEVVPEGLRDQLISEHALKNLYGFEYLIAPYTIAHLKLSQYLQDKGFRMKPKERLQIYLTNTLEPIEPQQNWLLPALSKEVALAQNVKEKPILVITGNPPYKGHSLNKGKWITGLIEDYRKDFPELKKPGQGKWLQDDYVKFIRFAQWKMESVDEGIVGIITNHSFLDNPTFKGMRKSLLGTFNQIYVLDLHGSSRKKETAPDGSKDENVFDIEQGVAISILIKKVGLQRKIFHADMWGRSTYKYYACMEGNINTVAWTQVEPDRQLYLFVPRDNELSEAYNKFPSIPEIFAPVGDSAPGIVTTHDEFAISFDKEEAIRKVKQLLDTKIETEARKLFTLCSQNQWNYERAKIQLANGKWKTETAEILYRPFDKRWTVFNSNVAVHRRERVMRHMLAGENVGIITTRLTKDDWSALATDQICAHKSGSRYDISYLFPLYLYLFKGKERIENIAPAFRQFIDKKYGHHYEPEEILGYIYAVLHSPTYRRKYAEFLKIDFPRIPFVDDHTTFEKLAALGRQLVQAHLLKDIPATLKVEVTKGSDAVEKPVYAAPQQRLYFNAEQYFAPVPEDVWNFHIGGYQVLDKYLKSRKGRELSLDEKENIMNVIKVLRFTIDRMQEIDEIWRP